MKEYIYIPKPDMTHDELVSILSYMLSYARFAEIPHGAERHFEETGTNKPARKVYAWDRIKGFFSI